MKRIGIPIEDAAGKQKRSKPANKAKSEPKKQDNRQNDTHDTNKPKDGEAVQNE